MQVAITSRHGGLNERIQQSIRTKAEKLLTFFERVTAIQVTVNFEDDRIKVEILVDTEHKHNFVAHDVGEEVMPTFDQALHKMEQQIRKYKQKLQDHRRDKRMTELAEDSETESESDE